MINKSVGSIKRCLNSKNMIPKTNKQLNCVHKI